jgi:ubiquinone biosynthesis protein UbiJ
MNALQTLQAFESLAATYSDDPRTRLAYHLGLLQGHIRSQDHTIAILEEEIRHMINQLNKELA